MDVQKQIARLEDEKKTRFRGTARIQIDKLQFRSQKTRNRNVQCLVTKFRREGCQHQDHRYRLHAIVNEKDLKNAIENSGTSHSELIYGGTNGNVPELKFTGSVVECLHGWRRVAAAKQILKPSLQWWIVELYADGMRSDKQFNGSLLTKKIYPRSFELSCATSFTMRKGSPTDKSFANFVTTLSMASR